MEYGGGVNSPGRIPTEPARLRVHVFSMHTSPLARPGSGSAGGMNVYIDQLSRALAARGSSVEAFTLVTAPSGETTRTPSVRTSEPCPGYRVHEVFLPEARGAAKEDLPGLVPAFARACAEHARQLELVPEILHGHYWLSALAAEHYDQALGARAPLVLTLHTSARVKNAHAGAGEPLEPPARAQAEEDSLARAAAVVVNTVEEGQQLTEYYGLPSGKLHVIPPGTDLSVFHPASPQPVQEAAPQAGTADTEPTSAPAREGFHVVFAGRPQPLKGPEILIRALALARERVPGMTLEIRGTASPQYRASLQRLVEELSLREACALVPASSAEELAQALRSADLVACPSSSETFGLVALEAQACGTPVAVSDVSGLRAATGNGTSGHIVPERSPRAWATALVDLAGDTAYRLRLARAGLAHARTLTWGRAAESTEDLYRSLLRPVPAADPENSP